MDIKEIDKELNFLLNCAKIEGIKIDEDIKKLDELKNQIIENINKKNELDARKQFRAVEAISHGVLGAVCALFLLFGTLTPGAMWVLIFIVAVSPLTCIYNCRKFKGYKQERLQEEELGKQLLQQLEMTKIRIQDRINYMESLSEKEAKFLDLKQQMLFQSQQTSGQQQSVGKGTNPTTTTVIPSELSK